MDKFEKLIRKTLNGASGSDRKARMVVYQAAIKSIDAVPAEKQTELKKRLAVTISKIETEFQTSAKQSNSLTGSTQVKKQEFVKEPQTLAPNIESTHSADNLPQTNTDLLKEVAVPRQAADRIIKESPKSSNKWFIPLIVCGLMVLVWIGGWYALNNSDVEDPQIATGNTDDSSQLEKTANDPAMNTLVDLKFGESLDMLSTNMNLDSNGAETLKTFLVDGKIQTKENLTLFVGPKFDIETSKTYVMELKIASTTDEEFSPIVTAGFVTFGPEDELLTGKPGPHRYFVYSGRLSPDKTITDGRKHSLTGVISGEDTGALDKFLPNTKSGRIIIVIRPLENEPVILESLKLLEVN
jgi:hypothetical protein